MLCEHCKMREATVKYVEVVNGVKTEHNLCAHCAARLDVGQYSALFEGEFPLGKLLSGLLEVQNAEQGEERFKGAACPTCKTTYAEFVKNSRFGCADCYSVFGPLIRENIRHLQGSERHVGKRPDDFLRDGQRDAKSTEAYKLTVEETRELLKRKIKDAVSREDYETAASLRDRLHKLEGESKGNGEVV